MSASRNDELIRRPHPRLRPFVGDYAGYDISGVRAGTHLGLPSGTLTFIVSIDEPLCQVEAVTGSCEHFDVLLAGLHLRSTLIAHPGAMSGIQINFSPSAPRAFFGIPAAEFAHHSVDVARISRPLAAELHERVNLETEWSARFAAIDDVLMRTLDDTNRPAPRWPTPGNGSPTAMAVCPSPSSPMTSDGADAIWAASSGPNTGSAQRRRTHHPLRSGTASDPGGPGQHGGDRDELRLRRSGAPQPGLPGFRRPQPEPVVGC